MALYVWDFFLFLVLSSPPHQLKKKKSLDFSVNGGSIGKGIAMWVGELLQNVDTQGRGDPVRSRSRVQWCEAGGRSYWFLEEPECRGQGRTVVCLG